VLRQSPRAFVSTVDFITSVGYGDGPGFRERLGLPGKGPTLVITDLGQLQPDPSTLELTLTAVHPGLEGDSVLAATRRPPPRPRGGGPPDPRRAGHPARPPTLPGGELNAPPPLPPRHRARPSSAGLPRVWLVLAAPPQPLAAGDPADRHRDDRPDARRA